MATYLDLAIAKLKEFEGAVPWMYLDTAGKVTVGVGLMLATESAAERLAFVSGTRPATAQEINDEFARVLAMKAGQLAKFYRRSNGLTLPEVAIEERLRETLVGFEGYLRTHVTGYDLLPDAARLALLDMVYNLGPGRFFAEYPRLIAAVERGDWRDAATASHRRGPAQARNDWTRQQFLDAAKSVAVSIEAAAESSRWTAVLFGGITGVVVAVAVAILFGEADRLAAARRSRPTR